jgi:hypothetical protein
MGRFNASSREYKPAPANERWVTNRLTKGLHAKVLSISTSTTPRKFAQTALLVGSCLPYDQTVIHFLSNRFHPKKSLHGCTLRRTIWNRDMNTSRNMVYLALHKVYGVDRPVLFSSRLAQAPIVRDVDIDNITSTIDAMNIE